MLGVWAVAIGVMAVFFNNREVPGAGHWSHPIAHFVVFGLLAVAARVLWPRIPVAVVAAVLAGAGVLLEVAQAVSGSDAEARDVVVDVAGIATGLALVAIGRRLHVPRRLAAGTVVVLMAASLVALPLFPVSEDVDVARRCDPEGSGPSRPRHGPRRRAAPRGGSRRSRRIVPALTDDVDRTNEVTVSAWFRPPASTRAGRPGS